MAGRWSAEALGVCPGSLEHDLVPMFRYLFPLAVVHRRWRQHGHARVTVLAVPLRAFAAKRPRMLLRSKPLGKRRLVMERLELRLGVWVVIAYVWATMGPYNVAIDKQLGHALRRRGRAVVTMDRQLPRLDRLLLARRCDPALSRTATVHPTM